MFGEQVQQAAKVFAPNDFFGVLPERHRLGGAGPREPGGLALARAARGRTGKTHEYAKQPVTQADRDRVLAQVREHGKQFGMPQELPIEYPFADTKPPFDFALGRPNGEVWLQRPRAKEDAPLTYDVFDRKGAWQRAVDFPAGASLAGFGREAGRSTRSIKEEDGTRTVGRFALK